MSTKSTIILVLSALLLLSLVVNYYQNREHVLLVKHYEQGHTLDSLQLSVYEASTAALEARTAQLQQVYLDTKNRYTALKVVSTPVDNLSDDALAKILKTKLIPMGGP